ncbi:MAG: ROK family protein [Tannerella sp.]|jgi:predicted NBD/HSP70 family sugar kinase/mannose-6-phosphate isomerase class I|nr:ROK family protein [Tannerella sp.]
MKQGLFIGVDIGGTHVSAALVNTQTGDIVGDIQENIVNCNGTSTEILQSWEQTVKNVLLQTETRLRSSEIPEYHNIKNELTQNVTDNVEGIGIAIPGPFDYKNGISLIEGVQKFDALYAMNIKESFRKHLYNTSLRSSTPTFINDASAFALGEYYAGAAKGSAKALIITLGTGFGSAFISNGELLQTATGETPDNGYLYNIPFGESIADDYFSTRWFVEQWNLKTGMAIAGVKEIVQLAEEKNKDALDLFEVFAENLSQFIYPWLNRFNPEAFVIGGNIAKASRFFLKNLKEKLNKKGILSTIIKTGELWDKAPIVGAAMYARSLCYDGLKDYVSGFTIDSVSNKWRKSTQFLAPEKSIETMQGAYDIYPAFPMPTATIESGAEALAHWISRHKKVVIDGYTGIFWHHLIESLQLEFLKKEIHVRWFHVDAAMRPPDEIDRLIAPYLGGDDPLFGKITDKKLTDWFYKEKLEKIKPDTTDEISILVGCGAALAGWDAPLIYIDLPKNELQFRMRAGTATNLGADKTDDNRLMYKRSYFVDWRVLNEHKCNILPKINLIVDGQRPDHLLMMSGDNMRRGLDEMSRNFFRVRPWFEPGAWGGTWMKSKIGGLNHETVNLAWSFELMVLENGLMFENDGYRLEISFDFLMYHKYKEVLGDCAERFKYDFPIRFDFLDTFDGSNLSVQCHPDNDYAKNKFVMPFTQDETYYILDCRQVASVYLGFRDGIDPDKFHKTLTQSHEHGIEVDIEKYVQKHNAHKHDLFLIPNGTIHASGKDNLVLEISSAPYIFTFKMYDWLRLDLDGKPRPLNIEHGMKNLRFERQGDRVVDELICKPVKIKEENGLILEHLPTHNEQFYDIYRYSFDREISIETNNKCHVWMLVEGSSIMLETASGMKQRFNYAETFVVPASAISYKITNESTSRAIMVKSFVKSF